MPEFSTNKRLYDIFIIISGLLITSIVIYKNSYFLHDDAFITLRYAVNFASTGLPQWNIGEWAEGYTSLMHLTLEAILIRLGVAPLTSVYLVNTTALIALISFSVVAARIINETAHTARLFITAAIAASPPIALWVIGGLESIVVAAFFMAALAALLANLRTPRMLYTALTALAFSCAILTRLDSAVFIAASGLAYAMVATTSPRHRLTTAALIVGVPATVSFIQMAIRHSIYGELFPLTFYAKTDFSIGLRINNGLIYLQKSLPDMALFAIAGAVLLAITLLRRRDQIVTLLIVPVLAHFFYVIWAGGDHMPAARILLPLFAPLALLIYAVGTAYSHRVGVVLTGLTAATIAFTAIQRPAELMDNAAFSGGIIGRHIDKNWPRDITIALNTAGSTPYYSRQGRDFIDMLGLNDTTIAKRENTPIRLAIQRLPGHAKGDGAYVLSRKPDRIIPGPSAGTEIENSWFLSGTEMAEIPEFHRCYEMQTEQVPYSAEVAKRGVNYTNPLPFTFYVRTCED